MLARRDPCRLVGLAWLLLGLAAGGCATPTGQLSGKVTLKKKAVANADLRFERADNAGEFYRGLTSDDGTYHVDYKNRGGLPVGAYKVVITYYTLRNKLLPPGEAGEALKHEQETLAHEIAFEKSIAVGAQELHFELSEGKKIKTSGGKPPEE